MKTQVSILVLSGHCRTDIELFLVIDYTIIGHQKAGRAELLLGIGPCSRRRRSPFLFFLAIGTPVIKYIMFIGQDAG